MGDTGIELVKVYVQDSKENRERHGIRFVAIHSVWKINRTENYIRKKIRTVQTTDEEIESFDQIEVQDEYNNYGIFLECNEGQVVTEPNGEREIGDIALELHRKVQTLEAALAAKIDADLNDENSKFRLVFRHKTGVASVPEEGFWKAVTSLFQRKSTRVRMTGKSQSSPGLIGPLKSVRKTSSSPMMIHHQETPTIVTEDLLKYDKEQQVADVRFYVIDGTATKGAYSHQSYLHLTWYAVCSYIFGLRKKMTYQRTHYSDTTVSDCEDIIKNKMPESERQDGYSLWLDNVGSRWLSPKEHPIDYLDHWSKNKTRFVFKRNKEFIRFYLDTDASSFWTFGVTSSTTARDICERIADRFDLEFSMYVRYQETSIPDDKKILFVYYQWVSNGEEKYRSFVLKQNGPRPPKSTFPEVMLQEDDQPLSMFQVEEQYSIPLSKLKLQNKIGEGNYAKVMCGVYRGELVAVKQMKHDPSNAKYIQREIDLLQQLHHPNIVKFIGCSEESSTNSFFMIFEYVAKGDLRNLLSDESMHLSWKLRLKIAIDVANALSYCLSKNFIHRDLKSDNLLVQNDFTVKLCDFGLARDYSSSGNRRTMTLCGTDEWMSPEIIMGMEYGPEVDIYSYGMVMVELMTRKRPPLREPQHGFDFPRDGLKDVPESCPPHFVELALHCLQYQPSNRPTIDQILQRLLKIEANLDQ